MCITSSSSKTTLHHHTNKPTVECSWPNSQFGDIVSCLICNFTGATWNRTGHVGRTDRSVQLWRHTLSRLPEAPQAAASPAPGPDPPHCLSHHSYPLPLLKPLSPSFQHKAQTLPVCLMQLLWVRPHCHVHAEPLDLDLGVGELCR